MAYWFEVLQRLVFDTPRIQLVHMGEYAVNELVGDAGAVLSVQVYSPVLSVQVCSPSVLVKGDRIQVYS